MTQPLLTSQLARQALPSAPARPSRRSSWFLLLALGSERDSHLFQQGLLALKSRELAWHRVLKTRLSSSSEESEQLPAQLARPAAVTSARLYNFLRRRRNRRRRRRRRRAGRRSKRRRRMWIRRRTTTTRMGRMRRKRKCNCHSPTTTTTTTRTTKQP